MPRTNIDTLAVKIHDDMITTHSNYRLRDLVALTNENTNDIREAINLLIELGWVKMVGYYIQAVS